ncbi:GGDEF domain-containing protein [Anoxybacillus sp. J5B_2022]|uniref:GGDEF domain-containing protein n=1 Tax=Anoxybacillus sp. J5B_2022 TaxID=3003246 RepID=UPI0022869AE0|nr:MULTISPECIES: diguanylate cyclase [unclassified Anoxybacillus]MCL6587433.1 diguanylate cyclase [Anoxybacillus sp.]MCZ0756226.1 diguanylate cyclase [Anoxybacillus sp. J5B_2022]
MVQSVLSNICILLLVHLCIQTIYFRRSDWAFLTPKRVKWLHILFVSFGTVAMFYTPIFLGDYRFDLRTIPVAFLALLQGPSYAIPALVIASGWRWALGGSGVVPGIVFGLVLPTSLALFFHRLSAIKRFSYAHMFLAFSAFWLLSDLPIVFLVPEGWEAFKQIAPIRFFSFHLGAALLFFFVRLAIHHVQLVQKLRFYADHDPLTHLYNMRKFVEVVNEQRTPRYLAMIDVDFFKHVNDTYGHQNGDEVLKTLAQMIRTFAPDRMVAGRYGGEEFIACLSVEKEAEAVELLNRLRTAIERRTFFTIDGQPLPPITVSIGVAPFNCSNRIEKAIEQADQYLYIAKQTGRNKVVWGEVADQLK